MRRLFLLAAAAAAASQQPPLLSPLSPPPSDAFLIGCAQGDPSCDAVWRAPVPPVFRVAIPTTQGTFTVLVNASWAPAFAARFFVLSQLSYSSGGPFYRVLQQPGRAFVAQLGYRGAPAVDLAWIAQRTSNATERVALSNTRGTVAFGTSEVPNSGANPYCTAAQCSQGFSVELFVNLADNAAKLDAADFSPFGVVEGDGMAVLDRVFAGYGECSDLCQQEPSDPYCVPAPPPARFAGVNLTYFLSAQGGWDYLQPQFPLLDRVSAAA